MKNSIVVMCSEQYKPLAELTVNQNKKPYCERLGYDLHARYLPDNHQDIQLIAFDRLEFLMGLMATGPDGSWYWVQGVDTMIMNFNVPMESFIDDKYDFIISPDINGLNADSILVKNSSSGQEWVRFLVDNREVSRYKFQYEQTCIIENYRNDHWKDRIKVIPQKSFNSYQYGLYPNLFHPIGEFSLGDCLLHWPGLSLGHRIKLAKEHLPLVIK